VQLADAQSMLARTQTELAKLPFMIQAAEANVEFTKRSLDAKQSVRSAVAGRVVQRAESDHVGALAGLQELRQREPNLKREFNVLQSKVDALQTQLELLVEETRQLEEAAAKVQSSTALCDEAKLQLRQAELALARNVVRAPMDGRILRLIASPGTRMMGLSASAGQSSSTVVEMYDPTRLQVRADVRLEDVPLVTRGQPVEIETASSADVIRGRVLQATSTANIQKNTLEVKIELIEPPATVSPEMLVTATFLAPEVFHESVEPPETDRIFIPAQLVQTNETGSSVWIVDADALAQQRAITLGNRGVDGLVEVSEGISVTDKLIASGPDGLKVGWPVNVTGEDRVIGVK
jgi:RND family efflux transporter MFP subunit